MIHVTLSLSTLQSEKIVFGGNPSKLSPTDYHLCWPSSIPIAFSTSFFLITIIIGKLRAPCSCRS